MVDAVDFALIGAAVDAHLAVGSDMTDQAYLLRFAGTFVIIGIAPVACMQRDNLFNHTRAQEVAHARETAVAGLFDPHAEGNSLVFEQ